MPIHVDFAGVGAVAESLRALSSTPTQTSRLDLSSSGSDLVASAAQAFANGWSDARTFLTLTSNALASNVDGSLADFLAAERAHLDSLTESIGALDQ